MKDGLFVQEGIIIPEHELEVTTSRAGGPGGQHVNKTDTRVTLHWNVIKTQVLDEEQKQLLLHKLHNRLTSSGELVVHNNSSRSQHHNKQMAYAQLAEAVRKALQVPKKRMKVRMPKTIKEARLRAKARQSALKKMRNKKFDDE